MQDNDEQRVPEIEETVIKIYRCAKVMKGGRRFSFAALVVVGNKNGRAGLGYGKANDVPSSVEKGVADAKKKLQTVHLDGNTLPHAVVGRFDPSLPGLQIWCRSRHNEHQKPFVFDAEGRLIAAYEMDDVAPDGWTARGVEVINCVDWTGEERQLAAAKERHKAGDVCIFDPISGDFLLRIPEQASRLD